MCKYCINLYTGNDFRPILEDRIEGDIDGYCSIYLGRRLGIRPVIHLDVTLLNTPIIMDAIPIHYCPMCGEELKEDKNEEDI